ncbi:MAG: type II secretion system protein [Parcubacteria group bacterium]|nr:type II secretion system protein [Parcubacteria group bacterium]
MSKNLPAQGFTLIELLVVIAIIGVLSSVVFASLNSARTRGNDAARISNVKSLETAMELYYGSVHIHRSWRMVQDRSECEFRMVGLAADLQFLTARIRGGK